MMRYSKSLCQYGTLVQILFTREIQNERACHRLYTILKKYAPGTVDALIGGRFYEIATGGRNESRSTHRLFNREYSFGSKSRVFGHEKIDWIKKYCDRHNLIVLENTEDETKIVLFHRLTQESPAEGKENQCNIG